jgi:hypothetical protein
MERLSHIAEHIISAEPTSSFSWEGLERDSIEGVRFHPRSAAPRACASG